MWIDIAFALIVGLLVVLGWAHGLLKQALRLALLVGCIIVAPTVGELLAPLVGSALGIESPDAAELVARVVGGGVLYFGLLLLAALAIKLIHDGSTVIELTDRSAGALLGAAKGIVIVVLVSFALVNARTRGVAGESRLGHSIDGSATLGILTPIMAPEPSSHPDTEASTDRTLDSDGSSE